MEFVKNRLIKQVLMLMLIVLLSNCSFGGFAQSDKLGIDNLISFADTYYRTCQTSEADKRGEKFDINTVFEFVPDLYTSFNGFDLAMDEAKELSNQEIEILIERSDKFELGENRAVYKHILGLVLIGIQSGDMFFGGSGN